MKGAVRGAKNQGVVVGACQSEIKDAAMYAKQVGQGIVSPLTDDLKIILCLDMFHQPRTDRKTSEVSTGNSSKTGIKIPSH